MNKQTLLFGIGGMVVAVLLVFFLSKSNSSIPQPETFQTNNVAPSQTVSAEVSGTESGTINEQQTLGESSMNKPPEMQIDQNKSYSAVFKTSEGDITIKFNPVQTPITVNNFVSLARDGFYNGTIFHRVIEGFMIQGGDPEGTGAGGPGYQFADEPFTGEYTRGTVAMANAGPNTNGSQFFIMHQDNNLPKNYVIFGKVTSGIEVVDKIATAPTQPGGEGSTPINPVKIESVEIIEK